MQVLFNVTENTELNITYPVYVKRASLWSFLLQTSHDQVEVSIHPGVSPVQSLEYCGPTL